MMGSYKSQTLVSLLLLLSLSTFSSHPADAKGVIAIYWGQNGGEGDLTTACDTGHYGIVLLAFLNNFGLGQTPSWNFAGHCGDWDPPRSLCTKLEPEIKHCQSKGIKVLLSLGGAAGTYGLSSPDDAKSVAQYLYDNFLTGNYGPLGSVTLDGIDFDIERSDQYWENLAYELDARRQPPNRYFYLSAAPQCPCPPQWPSIYYLDKAIRTWLFDYVFVQFYNNPDCSYAKGLDALLRSWDDWVNLLKPNNSLFMGLPASPAAAGSGYISPETLISDVLPHIKQAVNYGGVMLWDRFNDLPPNDYSGKILPYVPTSSLLLDYVAPAWRRFLPISN